MNKVVSIEIAGQVFWIDEDAYGVLRNYLEQIKKQLVDDECAKDIYKDIELRIAELLFELRSDEKKAISAAQLEQVIEQVGFIEGEEVEMQEAIQPKISYRDPQNKILAGVCAGLATRLGVPAFIIRVVFLGLTLLFGLGAILYLIFWFSLDTTESRKAALAAQGKAQTAKQIAQFEAPKANPLTQLQRIIFLPFSLIGTLVSVFGEHFVKRRRGYLLIFKNLIAATLLFFTALLTVGIVEFNYSKMFSKPVLWILSAAAIYMILLALFIYTREFYFRRPGIKVDKRLKRGAIVPVFMFAAAMGTLHFSHLEHESKVVEKQFTVLEGELYLNFNDEKARERYADNVRYQVITREELDNKVSMHINYSSSGKNKEQVTENIKRIDFYYAYNNNTLELDNSWKLEEDALNRSQSVSVIIEVPQNIKLTSSRPLSVYREDNRYKYYARHYYYDRSEDDTFDYLTSGPFIHELGNDFKNKLSENEREILNEKFCEEFFIGESWGCSSNIRKDITDNYRFDKAFMNDSDNIDQIRQYLLPDRSLFVSNLSEINLLVNDLTIEYPVKGKFQLYIEHLLKVKSNNNQSSSADRFNESS